MDVKKLLTKKVGPLPAFAYPLIAVGGYVAYKRFSGGGGSSSADALAGSYYDAAGNLYDANGNLIQAAQDGSQNGSPTVTVPAVDGGGGSNPLPPALDPGYLDSVNSAYLQGANAGYSAGYGAGNVYSGTAPTTAAVSTNDKPPPITTISVPEPSAPLHGILSVTRLLNGATLTTLSGGRQIEQAPGKTAYVVNQGAAARNTYVPPVVYASGTSVRKLANGATVTTFADGREVEQAKGKKPYVIKKGNR